jgi:hypothetical protein
MWSLFRASRNEKTPPCEGGAVIETQTKGDEMFVAKTESESNSGGQTAQGKTPTHKKVRWWIQNPPDSAIRLHITPELADEMLQYNTNNRPFSPGVVEKYARQMKGGGWRLIKAPIVFSVSGRIQDGQHRLRACLESGVGFDAWVAFGDAEENFAFIDIGKARGASDIFAINGVKNWAMAAAASRWCMAYDANAMSGGPSGLSFSPVPADIYTYYTNNKRIADSVHVGQKFISARLVSPSLMTALHYICARKSRAQADEFFEKVATGIGFTNRTEPAYKLHKRLIDNATGAERLRLVMLGAFTIKAWNAMRNGTPTGVFRWRGEQNPNEAFPKAM